MNFNLNQALLIFALSAANTSVLNAAIPLWTFEPLNPTTITLSNNSSNEVSYLIKNKSSKFKKLLMRPAPGVTQLDYCYLAPIGHPQDSCILRLVLNGSAIPTNGIHSGPILCQVSNDKVLDSQCYQPSPVNQLNVKKVNEVAAIISSNLTNIQFNAQGTATVNITNSPNSLEAAQNIEVFGLTNNLFVQNNTCATGLTIGASCSITFAAEQAEGLVSVQVKGANTNTIPLNITVNPLANTSLVIGLTGGILCGQPKTITLTNTGNVVAENLTYYVTNGLDNPLAQEVPIQCNNLAAGASCNFDYTPTSSYPAGSYNQIAHVQGSNVVLTDSNSNLCIQT